MSAPLPVEDRVRIGMVCAGSDRESVLKIARGCEATGFDSLWLGDHLSFHVPILESGSMLSFLAAATERITLGTSVYLLPLRPPVVAAKTIAAADVLSAGRVVLGVGVGGEFPPEFEAAGVPVAERGSRTDEAIPLLRRLWSEDGVVHEGRHFHFGPVSLDPKPVQAGGPPIWIGGRKEPAFRRAGRLGDGYISHMASAEMVEEHLAKIAGYAREAGRSFETYGTAAFLFAVLDDDYEKALERAVTLLGAIYRTDFRRAAPKYVLLGRPEDFLEQMRRFAAAGTRHFILSPLSDPVEFSQRMASELLPSRAGLLA